MAQSRRLLSGLVKFWELVKKTIILPDKRAAKKGLSGAKRSFLDMSDALFYRARYGFDAIRALTFTDALAIF